MITEAFNLLKTALVLLAFLQANPTIATPALRETAFKTANEAIQYAQVVIKSNGAVAPSVSSGAGGNSGGSSSSGSSAPATTQPPATTPVPVVSLAIGRPFSYEVMPMQLTSFPVTISAASAVTAKLQVLATSNNAELYSQQVSLTKGENTIQIPLSNLSSWKGGWLNLKVLQENRTDNSKTAAFGVGFLFLTAGQSNSANFECSLCTSSHNHSGLVSFLSDPAVTNTSSGFNPSPKSTGLSFVINTEKSPLSDGPDRNVWLPLGEKIAQEYRVPVAFVAIGQGGASIAQWNSNLKPLFSYGKLFPRMNGVLWHQGETDTLWTTPKDTYRDTLLGIIQTTRSDYGYDVPWLVANATFCNVSNSYREITIRQAQQEVVSYGLKAVYPGPDTDAISHVCHFDTLEQLNNYTNAWWNSLKINGVLDVNSWYLNEYLKR